MNTERWILLWLRLTGSVLVLAFLATLLPTEWMKLVHEEWVGLRPFPESPLVEYLTRSIALLYGFHGALVLLTSTDIHRFRPVIVFIGWLNAIFGAAMFIIDWKAGLPILWTLGEGPPICGMGLVLLRLLRGLPKRWPTDMETA